MGSVVDEELLLPYAWISMEEFLTIVQSKQSLTLGYKIMSGGGVWNLQRSFTNDVLNIEAVVASHKSSGSFYCCSISIMISGFVGSSCTCVGAKPLLNRKSQLCKHSVAILAALDALRNASLETATPKRFKRKGLATLEEAPRRMKLAVEAHLTWKDILLRLSTVLPKERTDRRGYNKVIRKQKLSKKRKRDEARKKTCGRRFLESLTVDELQQESKRRGLDMKLKRKEDLIKQLLPFYESNETGIEVEGPIDEKQEEDKRVDEDLEKSEAPESGVVDVVHVDSSCLTKKDSSLSRQFEFCLLEGKRERKKRRFFDDD